MDYYFEFHTINVGWSIEYIEGSEPGYNLVRPVCKGYQHAADEEGSIRTFVKSAYQKNNFLTSKPNHMLWVLKRTLSMRLFF